jgi:hypothetical protein
VVALAGALAGMMAGAGVGAVAGALSLVLAGPLWLGLLVAWGLLGLWCGTLVIRILATIRHLIAGYQQMPANILRLAVCTAPLHIPELLPGLAATIGD